MLQTSSSQVTQQDARSREKFIVERKREQHDYERLLVGKSPWMMVITGMAGTGKSTLLHHLANKKSRDIPVITLDFAQPWAQIDILTILEKLAEQVSGYCNQANYTEFKKTLKIGREKLAEVGKSKQVMVAKSGGVIIGGEQQITKAENFYKAALYQVWGSARSEFHTLIETFSKERLVIMLDSSEWLSGPGNSDKHEVGHWILNDFAPQLHNCMLERHQCCSFVVASQDRPQLPAISRQDIIDRGPLDMWTQEDIKEFLQHEELGNGKLSEWIYQITRGHPSCVSLIAETWVKRGDKAQVSIDKLPQIQQDLNAKEWLKHFAEHLMDVGRPWRFSDLARYSALLRTFDDHIMQAVFQDLFLTEKELKEQIKQLNRASFVLERGERHALHDLLREILATHVRIHEPQKWHTYHLHALNYLAGLPKDQVEKLPHPLDWYYHSLAYNEASGLKAWKEAVDQAYSDGKLLYVCALLTVAQDRTLELSPQAYGMLSCEQGHYDYNNNHWEDALNNYKQSLVLYREAGSNLDQAEAYTKMADVQRYRKDARDNLADALNYYSHAYDIYRQVKDPLHQAYMIQGMGDIQRLLGKFDEALANYDKALTLYEALGEKSNQAYLCKSMGDTLVDQSRKLMQNSLSTINAAKSLYDQAERLFPEDDYSGLADLYKARGDIQVDVSREGAIQDYRRALDNHQKMGGKDQAAQASIYIAIGNVEKTRKEWDEAKSNYELALKIYADLHDRGAQASMHQSIGEMDQKLNDWDGALRNYRQGITDSLGVWDFKKAAYLYQLSGKTLQERNDKETGLILEKYGNALRHYQLVWDNAGAAYVCQIIGELEQSMGRKEEALEDFKQALMYYEHASANGERDDAGTAYIYQVKGKLEQSMGRKEEALEDYRQALANYEHAKDNRERDDAGTAYIYQVKGKLEQSMGRKEEALEDFKQALMYYEHASANGERDDAGTAYVYQMMGEVEQVLENLDVAMGYYKESCAHYQKGNQLESLAHVYEAIGDLQRDHPEFGESIESYDYAKTLYYLIQDQKGLERMRQAVSTLQQAFR